MKKTLKIFKRIAEAFCAGEYHYDDDNFFGLFKYEGKSEYREKKQKFERARKFFASLGLAEDVNLLELTREQALEGWLHGRFRGVISGEIKTYSKIIFRWGAFDGRSFISELPVTKVTFEDTKGSPKIHFLFYIYDEWNMGFKYRWWEEDFILLRKNPNKLITPDYIVLATIKISEKDVGKYLKFN